MSKMRKNAVSRTKINFSKSRWSSKVVKDIS
jgi:hypothetical protein